MTVTVKHSKTNAISDWTQAQLDEQIELGNFAPGTTLANIVLPSDWNNDHTLTGVGTMAEQDANNVVITGGSINGTTIGATTASTGTFTTLIGGADVANYGQLTGGATTKAIEWKSLGSDSNVAFSIRSKGTGAIDLAAGSSGVNISNGGTVTAITRTAAGSAYTSFPTMAISAPTTAGGVQAIATFTMGLAGVPTITSGGTGYTVGNTLTFVGGTGTAATLTVSTVSAGVITGVTIANFGLYTALPSNPISVTGGSGSGATFTATWAINSVFTITNAGSGYIEQPTITFSGGGGSGAAAYASVGNTTTVKGLYGGASQIPIQFAGPSGNLLQIMESGNTSAPTPLVVKGGSSSTQLYANLSNSSIQFSSNGTGVINFYTNTLAQEQFRVSHTASAVNYVQVTGNTTTNNPTISAQGSDTNPSLWLTAKGSGQVVSRSWFTAAQASANYWQMAGASAGSSPALSVLGSDTNIDLALTPKGTGLVRFGTYVAGALTATGYINIKAADGTTYKVLVST